MPILFGIFGFLGTFVSSLFTQLLLVFGRKYTVGIASILAYIAITFVFIACIKTAVVFLIAAISVPAWIYTALAWFIPSNLVSCIAAVTSGEICTKAYRMSITKIKMMNTAA